MAPEMVRFNGEEEYTQKVFICLSLIVCTLRSTFSRLECFYMNWLHWNSLLKERNTWKRGFLKVLVRSYYLMSYWFLVLYWIFWFNAGKPSRNYVRRHLRSWASAQRRSSPIFSTSVKFLVKKALNIDKISLKKPHRLVFFLFLQQRT